MLSDLSKSALKMASEDPQKSKKVRKTLNCPASLAISEALTINPSIFKMPLVLVSKNTPWFSFLFIHLFFFNLENKISVNFLASYPFPSAVISDLIIPIYTK